MRNKKKIKKFTKIVLKKVLASKFIPGSLSIIRKFSKDFEIYICSATPQKELINICKEKKIFNLFKKIYGSPIEKIDNLKKIIKLNKNIKQNITYIGDANSDYIIAKKLNIKFISINNKIIDSKMNILNIKDLKNYNKIYKFILQK